MWRTWERQAFNLQSHIDMFCQHLKCWQNMSMWIYYNSEGFNSSDLLQTVDCRWNRQQSQFDIRMSFTDLFYIADGNVSVMQQSGGEDSHNVGHHNVFDWKLASLPNFKGLLAEIEFIESLLTNEIQHNLYTRLHSLTQHLFLFVNHTNVQYSL